MFLDDKAVFTFMKRPDWSPDGSFFLLPSATYQETTEDKQEMCVFVFRRIKQAKPSLVLKTNNKPALCTKFCKKIFKK